MKRFFWMIFTAVMLAGCNAAPAKTPPTTWTPSPVPGSVRATFTPLSAHLELVTPPTRVLPATWTPEPDYTITPPPVENVFPTEGPRISVTPSMTATFDYQEPPPPLRGTRTLPAECAKFRIEKGLSSPFIIRMRDEARIVWNALEAPVIYWVWVRHPDGRYVVRQAVTKPEIDIKNPTNGVAVFNAEGVYPVAIAGFRNGTQVCQQVTDIFIVRGSQ